MSNQLVFAIDGGSTHSGYAIVSEIGILHREQGVDTFGKVENSVLSDIIRTWASRCTFPIEFPYPKHSTVPYEVFLMTAWVGRWQHIIEECGATHHKIFRHREKSVMCKSGVAKDSQIRAAVIAMYGDKGTHEAPGPTFGVTGDVWQAIAIATTFLVEGDSSKLPPKEKKKPKQTKKIPI
jgi:hypothetical protein